MKRIVITRAGDVDRRRPRVVLASAGERSGDGHAETGRGDQGDQADLRRLIGDLEGAKVEPGAMGPGSPATTSHGKVAGRSLLGGLWFACDVEDSYAGKPPMTWKGHMVVGYDVTTKSYKASVVDNLGTLAAFDGTLEGTKFMLVTPSPVMMMGQMMKDRLSWDLADPKAIKFTDEHQLEGGEWTLVESATMAPVMKSAKPVASGTGCTSASEASLLDRREARRPARDAALSSRTIARERRRRASRFRFRAGLGPMSGR